MAVDDDLTFAVELVDALAERAKRDELGTGNLRDRVFMRLAYVDDTRGASLPDALRKLARRDLADRCFFHHWRSAKGVVVDELANFARAARGTFRISANLHCSEPSVQRV